MTVTEAWSHGINVVGGSNDVVTGTTTSNNRSVGVRLSGTQGTTVTGGVSSGNDFHGISVQGASADVRVSDMVSTGNDKPTDRVATGIDVSGGSTGTIVERNTTSGNDDTGIQVYSGSTGTIVRRNVTYDNGDHGVDLNNAPGTTVVSNTSVGNFTSGLNVEGGSTNVTLRNNISVDDATNSPRAKGNIRVDAELGHRHQHRPRPGVPDRRFLDARRVGRHELRHLGRRPGRHRSGGPRGLPGAALRLAGRP